MLNAKRRHDSRMRQSGIEMLEARRVLAPVTVSNVTDLVNGQTGEGIAVLIANDGGDGISLREAILAAVNEEGPDTILFESSISGTTIGLTEGDLFLSGSLTIDGGYQAITIDASGSSGQGIFDILGFPGEEYEINGLTLTGGSPLYSKGGAIRSVGANLTLRNTTITGNSSAGGGGLYFDGYGNRLAIESCTISDNSLSTGVSGGGIYITGADSVVIIRDTEISDNTVNATDGDGGGVFLSMEGAASSVEITNSVISGNKALGSGSNAGGMYLEAQGFEVTLDGLQILDNDSDDDGGGLFLMNRGAEIALLNSTISGNTAKDNDNGASGFGGGAGVSLSNYASGAITIIDSSTISGNRVVGVAGGGGVFVESKDGARATISNTTISGNEAEIDGGGLMMSRASHGGSLEVLYSTITNNRADSDENATGEGGGLNRHGSVTTTVTLHHTILSGNEGWNSSTTAIEPDNILGTIDGGSSFNLLGSNNGSFSGLPATTTPLNNIHSDTPGLAALSDNGGLTATHRLLWNSIARDAGDPSYSGALDFDQRGAAYERVFGGAIDIGAYEYNTLRITDVVLENASVSYSFAKQSWLGDSEQGGAEHRQLRPVFYGGLDRIEVHFSKPVNLDGDPLMLRYDQDDVYAAARTHTVDGQVVTWTFSSPLPDSKFALNIDVTKVTSSEEGGQSLDGEWDNSPGFNSDGHPTLDDWSDDPKFYFPSGNGIDGSTDSNRDGVSEFRFNFAILAGDYDGTGAIEVDELISGDGNGDGVIDALDAIGTVGDKLPLRESDHDYYDDDVVAARDLSLWESAFGTHAGQPGYDLRVDFDSDDDVDGTDFLIWQASYASTRSAWWYGSPMVNWPASVYAIGVAPQVVNVVVSGSESQHSAFSMSSVSGSGDQLRPVPVGGADTLSLVFNNEVNIVESDLTIVGLTTGNIPRAVEFVYDILSRTATWRFENLRLTGDLYLLSLSDAVTSSDGIHLDGEWVNPASISTANPAVSDFADGSGDNNPGGVFNFVISLLPGDANLDGIVAAADSAILLNNWGITGAAFTNGDFNGDGDVDGFQWPNEGDSQLLSQFWATDLRSLWILADLDSDYDVDGDDIDILVGNLGLTGALWSDGDLDGDGEVTVDDRDIAWAMYGMELDVVS